MGDFDMDLHEHFAGSRRLDGRKCDKVNGLNNAPDNQEQVRAGNVNHIVQSLFGGGRVNVGVHGVGEGVQVNRLNGAHDHQNQDACCRQNNVVDKVGDSADKEPGVMPALVVFGNDCFERGLDLFFFGKRDILGFFGIFPGDPGFHARMPHQSFVFYCAVFYKVPDFVDIKGTLASFTVCYGFIYVVPNHDEP